MTSADRQTPGGNVGAADVARLLETARRCSDSPAAVHVAAAEEALAAASTLLAASASDDAVALEAACLSELGEARRRAGDLRAALEALEAALARVESSGVASEGAWVGTAHHRIGVVYDTAGDPTAATAAFRRALQDYRDRGDATGMARVQNSLGIVYSRAERYEEAIGHFEASLEHAVRHGQRDRESAVHSNLSITTRLSGRTDEALRHAERALEIRRQLNPEAVNGELTNLALALAAAGRHEEAQQAFEEGERAHEEFGEPFDLAEHLHAHGEYLVDRGELVAARPPLERALALAEATGAAGLQGAAHEDLARLWKAAGDHERALKHFEAFHERVIAVERAASARELETQRWQAELALARAEADSEKREREALAMIHERLVHDHRDLEGRAAKLESDATLDPLTGLANRRAFDLRLLGEREGAAHASASQTLVLMDLDRFKSVNDRFGHAAGDEVLRSVAGVLATRLRSQDLAARIGGEEFAVLLPDTDLAGGVEVAAALRELILGLRWPGLDGALRVTASLGVASGAEAGSDPHELYALADRRLYAAKEKGRDRVEPSPER